MMDSSLDSMFIIIGLLILFPMILMISYQLKPAITNLMNEIVAEDEDEVSEKENVESHDMDEELVYTDTPWVYDESNSLSSRTIEYVTQLNENELEDYGYGVYVVDSLNGESMDSYKLDLFNELGVGTSEYNSGILFVLATEDREYGVEIGDGFDMDLRRKLSSDFVIDSAGDDLKDGNWDSAVYKVSQQVESYILEDFNTINSVDDTSTTHVNVDSLDTLGDMSATILSGVGLMFAGIALGYITYIFAGLVYRYIGKHGRFLRSDLFKRYNNKYEMDKYNKHQGSFMDTSKTNNNVINHMYRLNYDYTIEGLYKYMVDLIIQILRDDDSFDNELRKASKSTHESEVGWLDVFVKEHFTEDDFETMAFDSTPEIIEALNNVFIMLTSTHNNWLDQLSVEHGFDAYFTEYVRDEISMGRYVLDSMNDFEVSILKDEREYFVMNKLVEFTDVRSDLDVEDILHTLEGNDDYERYLSGATEELVLPVDDVNFISVIHSDDNVDQDVADQRSYNSPDNPWMRLWLYSNRTQRQINRKHRDAGRESSSTSSSTSSSRRSSSSTSSFGGGFSGGSSSGGGFSGGF